MRVRDDVCESVRGCVRECERMLARVCVRVQ